MGKAPRGKAEATPAGRIHVPLRIRFTTPTRIPLSESRFRTRFQFRFRPCNRLSRFPVQAPTCVSQLSVHAIYMHRSPRFELNSQLRLKSMNISHRAVGQALEEELAGVCPFAPGGTVRELTDADQTRLVERLYTQAGASAPHRLELEKR